MRHHRSYRGSLASRIRDAMFSVFGENRLDPINTASTAFEISAWKRSPKTAKCYRLLFQPIKGDEKHSYISRILEKLWPKSDCLQEHVAFAITVCSCFLDPDNNSIQINEYATKTSLLENKVSLRNTSKSFK